MIPRIAAAFVATVLLFSSLSSLAPSASAHELLPKELLEFVRDNPEATDAQIEAFLEGNPDLYEGDTRAKLELIASAQASDLGFWHNAGDFVTLGMDHIFEGTDHILFVLSLLLVFTSIGRTLKLISLFTLSHSLSIILAGSDILTLSGSIVEPIIALSIAYVAMTTVFFRHIAFFASFRNKAITVFVFGLFHGLGFAGLLQEIAVPEEHFLSSLLFFNVGIEIGQVVIIGLALPFIYALRNQRWYPVAVKVAAALLSLVGLYWMIERIAGA